MAKVNDNYAKLPGSYLFSEIARRTAAYQEANPQAKLIKMGIGDVTRPLVPAVIEAMHAAVDDLATSERFHGYGPEQGYAFLREAIQQGDFAARGIDISTDEIFISDGAKSDCGNIGDILSLDNVVAVCDPVYPVYVDSNAMSGRAGEWDEEAQGWTNIVYMPTTAENGFCPELPQGKVDSVEQLLAQRAGKGALAFVGDGVNDAPVLTRADVGIAMGAMGSDAAIEAADVVLMDDDPRSIARALRLARKTQRIVWENIVFALGVKVGILVLAALGIANMWLAVFGDVGVAALAILNALRAMSVAGLR